MSEPRGRFSSLELKSGRRAAPTGPAGAPLRDAGYYMREGRRAELAGGHEKALTHYSAALGENPLHIEAWTAQLWMLLYLEEPLEAQFWADRALAAFPNQPDLLALKSLALDRCGLPQEAWELNDAALATGGRESVNVWLARGALSTAADGAAGEACFKHALAASADRPLTALRIGDLFLFHRRFAEAEAYLREAVAGLPDSAWAWYGYGLAQRAGGWEMPALAALNRAARLVPDDSRYYQAARVRPRGRLKRLKNWLARKLSAE
jgi:tetratricopeptide (TPR) repeat protein